MTLSLVAGYCRANLQLRLSDPVPQSGGHLLRFDPSFEESVLQLHGREAALTTSSLHRGSWTGGGLAVRR